MIDLRSDTVTRPGPQMRAAMAAAEVGDDVWGDDPTVAKLEEKTAALLGKRAAMFVPSGTQSNLCALLAHCQRGDEYIVGQDAHTYKYEAGGAAVLGSIQPQPIDFEPDGTLDLEAVNSKIKKDDPHFARTKLLALENTVHGKVLPVQYCEQLRPFADEHGLALHLDGARLWNAAAFLDVAVNELAHPFDSVSVCLSKGLGAPVGSVLAGSSELIDSARRWRKMLGGAMRQAGVLAAAGIYALDHHRMRILDDHSMATSIANALAQVEGASVRAVHTNMVFCEFENPAHTMERLQKAGISAAIAEGLCRLVTHLDLPADTPEQLTDALS